jgi:hypothetical protein
MHDVNVFHLITGGPSRTRKASGGSTFQAGMSSARHHAWRVERTGDALVDKSFLVRFFGWRRNLLPVAAFLERDPKLIAMGLALMPVGDQQRSEAHDMAFSPLE